MSKFIYRLLKYVLQENIISVIFQNIMFSCVTFFGNYYFGENCIKPNPTEEYVNQMYITTHPVCMGAIRVKEGRGLSGTQWVVHSLRGLVLPLEMIAQWVNESSSKAAAESQSNNGKKNNRSDNNRR